MPNILLIDDYTVTLRVLGQILERGGYNPILATNGLDALEILEQEPVDLIISDIDMPEMNGIMLVRHLRQDERFSQLPIIMLTASGLDEDRVLAEDAGANGFLTKPVSSNELLNAVGRYLQG